MINYAILTNYEDKFVGVVAHNYNSGKVFYKVINKYIDSLLDILFDKEFYREYEEDEIEFIEKINKKDKDYLEIALSDFEGYKVKEYYEDLDDDMKVLVRNTFKENI